MENEDDVIEVEIVEGDVEEQPEGGEVVEDDDDESSPAAPTPKSTRAAETEIERAKREAAEAKRERDQLKWEVENEKNSQQWRSRLETINREFTNAKIRIKQMAPDQDSPVDFYDYEMGRLLQWRDNELGKFHGAREAGYQEKLAMASVPAYADKLVKDHGLKKSDRAKLLEMPNPQMMEARAMGLADMRELERTVAGNNRKAAQRGNEVISTGGSQSGNVRRIKAGSDEHLMFLLTGQLPR